MREAVAKRYAAALFAIALELGRVEEFDAQAQFLEQVWEEEAVREFLSSPKVSPAEKKRIVQNQLSSHLDPLVLNLIKLLIDKKRVSFLPDVMRYFDVLTDRHRGVEEVTIVSAVALSEAQREALLREVRHFSTYDQLRVTTEVDQGVIGGVKVRLGENLVLDGTVSSRLSEMRERLYKYRHRGVAV